MKLAVVGTRTFERADLVREYLDRLRLSHPKLVIVSGGARGADRLAADYARHHRLELVLFRPNWAAHGRRAGALRNRQIVDHADALVAFWDEKSPGTRISLDMALQKGIPVIVVNAAGVEYLYSEPSPPAPLPNPLVPRLGEGSLNPVQIAVVDDRTTNSTGSDS